MGNNRELKALDSEMEDMEGRKKLLKELTEREKAIFYRKLKGKLEEEELWNHIL